MSLLVRFSDDLNQRLIDTEGEVDFVIEQALLAAAKQQIKVADLLLHTRERLDFEVERQKAKELKFQKKRKTAENRRESFERWIEGFFMKMDTRELIGTDETLRMRDSEAVQIVDERLIPEEFMRTKPPVSTPDLVKIKNSFKKNQPVPGARVMVTHWFDTGDVGDKKNVYEGDSETAAAQIGDHGP